MRQPFRRARMSAGSHLLERVLQRPRDRPRFPVRRLYENRFRATRSLPPRFRNENLIRHVQLVAGNRFFHYLIPKVACQRRSRYRG